MRTVKWLSCFWAAGLAGCSLYPIPDDVTSISTEDIVRHGRCEIRSAIIDYVIAKGLVAPSATENDVMALFKATKAKVKRRSSLSQTEKYIDKLAGVAVVYTFDFNITETNTADGGAAASLPFTVPKVFDLSATASLNLTRQGQRQFSAGDHWGNLILESELCKDGWPQHKNIVYPLNGSIGVGRVVRTFIDVADQGGAKDSFVDTLTFTTHISGDANASIKLAPVPHSFRLVSASAGLGASRLDVHKLIISLVFPAPSPPEAITGVERSDGDLNAPFSRPPAWRARYNLCVADARAREDSFKMLRLEAPEVYCIKYADSFAPLDGPQARPQHVIITMPPPGSPTLGAQPPSPATRPVPFDRRRPNASP